MYITLYQSLNFRETERQREKERNTERKTEIKKETCINRPLNFTIGEISLSEILVTSFLVWRQEDRKTERQRDKERNER